MTDDLPDAVEAVPWAPGRPAVRNSQIWRDAERPAAEVRLGGAWCPAWVTMRQDRADGAVIYHLAVMLPGETSPVHRAVIYDSRSFRPRT